MKNNKYLNGNILEKFPDVDLFLMLATVSFVLIKLKLLNIFFYYCTFACAFWEDFHYWFFPKFEDLPVLTKENLLFGLFLKDETHDLAIHTIITLNGKLFCIRTDS